MRILALCALALAVTACANLKAERGAERAAADDQKCQSYGFIPGNDGYAQCRMTMDTQRQQACLAAQNNAQAAQNRMAQEPAVSPLEAAGPMLGVANACR